MTRRSPRSWNRQDSLLVLAAYFEHGVPHHMERQRLANVLGMPVDAVMHRFNAFRSLERGEGAPDRETKLWAQYHDDRLSCLLESDEITEERRRLPYHLKKRLQS